MDAGASSHPLGAFTRRTHVAALSLGCTTGRIHDNRGLYGRF